MSQFISETDRAYMREGDQDQHAREFIVLLDEYELLLKAIQTLPPSDQCDLEDAIQRLRLEGRR